MSHRICVLQGVCRGGSLIGTRRSNQTDFENGESLMPGVYVKEDEPFENALKRFKKQVQKSGVLTETKKRRAYEKPSVKKKRKAMAARKRLLKKLRRMRRR